MKPTILVGNGINSSNNNLSWSDLLIEVINDLKVDVNTDNIWEKPFPLLYEEIYIKAIQISSITELEVKKMISDKVGAIQPNEIHKRITSGMFSDILTTNYEHTLEECISQSDVFPNLGIIKESKFNIFRHSIIRGLNFWHIHGDMDKASSILLGYEHYSGQLQMMRNYVVSGTDYKSKKVSTQPLTTRLGKKNYRLTSWIDHFFSGPLHIVGLSLDFIESDLWWLLTFRARKKFEKPRNLKLYKDFLKQLKSSEIYYYYPKKYYNQEKMQLMEANDINLIEIDKNSSAFYHDVLDRISVM
ncbi:MAG: SIR2 family protein [Bacteroidota bacterium]